MNQLNLPGNRWGSRKYMNFRSQRTFVFTYQDGNLSIPVPARNELTAYLLLSKKVNDIRDYNLTEVR